MTKYKDCISVPCWILVTRTNSEPINSIEGVVFSEESAKAWVEEMDKDPHCSCCGYEESNTGIQIETKFMEHSFVSEKDYFENNKKGGRFCSGCSKFHNYPMCEGHYR